MYWSRCVIDSVFESLTENSRTKTASLHLFHAGWCVASRINICEGWSWSWRYWRGRLSSARSRGRARRSLARWVSVETCKLIVAPSHVSRGVRCITVAWQSDEVLSNASCSREIVNTEFIHSLTCTSRWVVLACKFVNDCEYRNTDQPELAFKVMRETLRCASC